MWSRIWRSTRIHNGLCLWCRKKTKYRKRDLIVPTTTRPESVPIPRSLVSVLFKSHDQYVLFDSRTSSKYFSVIWNPTKAQSIGGSFLPAGKSPCVIIPATSKLTVHPISPIHCHERLEYHVIIICTRQLYEQGLII